jgi:multidrug efflux system membrane fusion protein
MRRQARPAAILLSTTISAAAISAALFTSACKTSAADAPPPGPPPPPAVKIVTAAAREVRPAEELSGKIEAVHRVDLRPRVSGTITAIRYREGSEVAAGAVLFTIDARPYRAGLARATAELARARARAELAHVESGRGDKLLAASAIAQAERDSLASSAAQADAEVAAAQAQLALARLDVEFTEVKAPIAGRAGRALVSIGDYVAAGPAPTPLTELVSVDPVYVYFSGDERAYLRFGGRADKSAIAIGLADETGYPHAGVVDFVDSRVDAGTGTVLLRAVVPNPDHRLAPGLFARVQLPEAAPVTAILIDDKAILTDQDRRFVYVLGAGDTVERRDVTLGRIVDGQRVITAGLKPGDRVIVTGIQKVFPGGKATVAQADHPAPRAQAGGAP